MKTLSVLVFLVFSTLIAFSQPLETTVASSPGGVHHPPRPPMHHPHARYHAHGHYHAPYRHYHHRAYHNNHHRYHRHYSHSRHHHRA